MYCNDKCNIRVIAGDIHVEITGSLNPTQAREVAYQIERAAQAAVQWRLAALEPLHACVRQLADS